MRVLVLGAAGHIGAHVTQAALAAGYEVRAARRARVGPSIEDARLEWVAVDTRDRRTLDAAIEGCEAVIHVAGYAPRTAHEAAVHYQVGVLQMRNVLGAARDAGVRRVVYTSSDATIGRSADPNRLADERDYYVPGSAADVYWDLKWLMEMEATRFVAQGLPIVTLNPTFVMGPGRADALSSLLVMLVAQGQLPVYPDGKLNVVDVRDVAAAHVAALEHGEPGMRIIVGNENLFARELIGLIAEAAGVPPPGRTIPKPLVGTAGVLGRAVAQVIAPVAPNRLTKTNLTLEQLRLGQFYSLGLAVQTLRLPRTPLRQTLEDTVAWLREQGHLPGRTS